MSADMEARWLEEEEFSGWEELVRESPQGSVYSTPGYLDVLCRATGGTYRLLGAFRNEELYGGIAVYEEETRLSRQVAPRLLLFYNGFVLKSFQTRYPSRITSRHLKALGVLEKALRSEGWGRVLVRNRHPLQDVRVFQKSGWRAWPGYSYEVPLGNMEKLWDRTDRNIRRLVERCAGKGLELTRDNDFESFYRMHLETHERTGAPLYLPREPFRAYVRRLLRTELGCLYHARLPNGRSIATQLVLHGGHPVSHTVTAAADGEFLRMGASAFLRWKVFQDLAEEGCEGNDLTSAALNPVTRFKSQLGGDLVLCLNVARPDSASYRVERRLKGVKHKARATLGRVAKGVLPLDRGEG